jgi:histidine kinase
LLGAIALGPKRSGDAWEDGERAGLAWIAERCAATLAAIESDSLLREARSHHSTLLAESDQKSRLMAAAGHDARQPLQALRLFLGTLESRLDDEELRSLVDKAQLSAIAMQQTFESLLDQARLDAGAIDARLERVDLGETFAELDSFLGPLARDRGLALGFEANGLAVHSDPVLLRSILQNLVANAIRYTDAGSVRLSARKAEEGALIEVADTGRGIPREELARLFEPGVRGESAHGETTGAGLGLSIVARLAELLGHRVEVSSEPGRGSTFRLRAELDVSAAPLSSASDTASARLDRLRGSRVWVIDDDAPTRDAMASLLGRWGVDVHCAASADELLAREPGAPPDAVLLDHQLGGGTGLDALDALEDGLATGADRPTIPAAIVSGMEGTTASDAARKRGLVFLRKPASPVRLRAALESLLMRAK